MTKKNGKASKKGKRSAEAILKDIVAELQVYNSLRDEEMCYEGMPEDWDNFQVNAYELLTDDINKSRRRLEKYLREATGNHSLEF